MKSTLDVRLNTLPQRKTSPPFRLNAADKDTGDGDVARKAARVIADKGKSRQPFFLAVGFRRPHAPYAAPDRYFDLYPQSKIRIPAVPPELSKLILPAARSGESYAPELAPDTLRGYYASISFMDAQAGVVPKS